MRRLLIRVVFPFSFCLIPLLGGSLVAVALPPDALRFYFGHLGGLDILILGLGALMFIGQTILCWRALPDHHPRRSQREANLRRLLRDRFYALSKAAQELAERTIRASSAVENLNSRLRNYFSLRRQLGPDYLTLLQFFLNHRRFQRSDRPERVDKSPAELLTGRRHRHWLELLSYTRYSRN